MLHPPTMEFWEFFFGPMGLGMMRLTTMGFLGFVSGPMWWGKLHPTTMGVTFWAPLSIGSVAQRLFFKLWIFSHLLCLENIVS